MPERAASWDWKRAIHSLPARAAARRVVVGADHAAVVRVRRRVVGQGALQRLGQLRADVEVLLQFAEQRRLPLGQARPDGRKEAERPRDGGEVAR